MRFVGIDIGSRTIELVVDEAGQIKASIQRDRGFDPITEAKKLGDGVGFDQIMVTGYGRNLFEIAFDAPTVTEIEAHAKGSAGVFPEKPQFIGVLGAVMLAMVH